MTSENQIAKAKALATFALTQNKVTAAHVDDWDDYGGCNIFVTVVTGKGGLPRGLIRRLQRRARELGGFWEWHDAPVRKYWRDNGRRYYEGYEGNSYKLSIRFNEDQKQTRSEERQLLL